MKNDQPDQRQYHVTEAMQPVLLDAFVRLSKASLHSYESLAKELMQVAVLLGIATPKASTPVSAGEVSEPSVVGQDYRDRDYKPAKLNSVLPLRDEAFRFSLELESGQVVKVRLSLDDMAFLMDEPIHLFLDGRLKTKVVYS